MTTKNPRINVMLEEPVYDTVRRLAEKENISVSLLIRDMVKEEIERYEDIYLSNLARERKKASGKNDWISPEKMWKKMNV